MPEVDSGIRKENKGRTKDLSSSVSNALTGHTDLLFVSSTFTVKDLQFRSQVETFQFWPTVLIRTTSKT